MSTRLVPASLFFHSLPRPLVTAILLQLPVNTRLRCSEVSRAWRALLADAVLWRRLNFFNVALANFSEALFVAAVAKAGGQLRELDVSGQFTTWEGQRLTHSALMGAVAANSQTLQRLRLCSGIDDAVPYNAVVELCTAALNLQKLEIKVTCRSTEARALLRREPPFGALEICDLRVDFTDEYDGTFSSFAADLQLHGTCLNALDFYSAPMPGRVAWDALADATISVCLINLDVSDILLGPWCVPGLARLLQEGCISSLRLGGSVVGDGLLVDAETEPVLSAASRANSTLKELALTRVDVWNLPGNYILDALVGHPTLESIKLRYKVGGDDAQLQFAGASLGRLVAANSPVLQYLDVSSCALGDDGLRPLVAALPSNTHLWFLNVTLNGISAAFAPAVLAAVRANRSLRALCIDGGMHNENDPGSEVASIAELREAEEVARRPRR